MLDIIKKRRSIRAYTDQEVTDEQVRCIMEAAMAAPSANNRRPWEFVVVRERGLRKDVACTHPWSYMAEDASVVFVVCGNERASRHWIEDTSAATQNMLLAVTALGLGAVWVGVYPDSARETYVRQLLGIPDHLRVLCLVPVGYPAESKLSRTQYDERKVHYNKY